MRDAEPRLQARAAVKALFDGFIERFGSTVCLDLTGVRSSEPAEVERYWREKAYEGRCLRYIEYAVAYGLEQANLVAKERAADAEREKGVDSSP